MLSLAKKDSVSDQRAFIVKLQKTLFDQAKLVAENGQFSEAGSLILKALIKSAVHKSAVPRFFN